LALILVAAALVALPGGAGADQASQPSAAVAGHLATGEHHSCAVVSAAVRCWGLGNDGRLGYGNTLSIGDDENPDTAGPIAFGRPVVAISSGNYHSCALLDNGTVRCWGFGGDGRLGYGNTDTIGDNEAPGSVGPVDLGAGRTAVAISAGDGHSCAVLDNGAVRCWGFNLDGRLGLGRTDSIGDNESPGSVAPIDFGPGRTAKAVSAGTAHTCAILDDNTVRCWGFGGAGRLGYANVADVGRGACSPPPVPEGCVPPTPASVGPIDLGASRTAKALTTGFGHTCAILDNDAVRCWGYAANGRLGYGNENDVGDDEAPGTVTPVDLGPGRTAKAIDAGREHTCAVLDNGALRCWGYGGFGQLGYGNTRSIGDNEKPSDIEPVSIGAGRIAD
jgi:alpha-tubulin suppressor-like RCC1 family protein